MQLTEDSTQSFIFKVWVEPEGDQAKWRGHVTHVPSGMRRHVTTLSGLVAFVTPYLVEMGLDASAAD